jgi:phytol kinase
MTSDDMSPTAEPKKSEGLRQFVHLGVGAFSLVLRFLLSWQAVVLGSAAVLFNFFVLPRLPVGRRISRAREAFVSGVRVYPVAVLMLIVFFPLPVAAAAWAILAVGDSFSNFVGRPLGKRKLPWNAKKSWAGTIAFAVTAIPAAAALLWWTVQPPLAHPGVGGAVAIWTCAVAGGLVGAAVESLDLPIDDNLTVSLASGVTMMLLAGVLS